jgi:hypothetical protein
MSICIAKQEHGLEKYYTGIPDGGCSSIQWQDHFANHGLDEEQQESAQKES